MFAYAALIVSYTCMLLSCFVEWTMSLILFIIVHPAVWDDAYDNGRFYSF